MSKIVFIFLIAMFSNLKGNESIKTKILKSEIKLASALKEYGYFKQALNHYENIAKLNGSISVLAELGILYKNNGKLEKAKKLLLQAVKKMPRNKEINNALGDIFFEEENFDKAEKFLKKIQGKEAVKKLALIANTKNNYKEALKYYKILVKKYKQEERRINLAILYQKLKNYENAEKELLIYYKNSKNKYYAIKFLIRFYRDTSQKEKLKNLIKKLKLKSKKRKMRPLPRSRY